MVHTEESEEKFWALSRRAWRVSDGCEGVDLKPGKLSPVFSVLLLFESKCTLDTEYSGTVGTTNGLFSSTTPSPPPRVDALLPLRFLSTSWKDGSWTCFCSLLPPLLPLRSSGASCCLFFLISLLLPLPGLEITFSVGGSAFGGRLDS